MCIIVDLAILVNLFFRHLYAHHLDAAQVLCSELLSCFVASRFLFKLSHIGYIAGVHAANDCDSPNHPNISSSMIAIPKIQMGASIMARLISA